MSTMKTMLFLTLFLQYSFAATIPVPESNPMNVVCYFLNGYGISKTPPETLDPNLCTHILYAFVTLDISGNLTYENKYVDIDNKMYKRVISLKEINPKLKVLASVSSDSKIFSQVAAKTTTRKIFAASARNYCDTFGFDGIDIDWEKPGAEDTDNFVDMLKELRDELDKDRRLLTVSTYPFPSIGYNVKGIVKYVHMIHIMCYNFYGSWSAYTGHNSPLFPALVDSNYEKTHLNIAASITRWLQAGAPKEKINVGIPFFGRTFTLVDSDDHGYHSPITGGGIPSGPAYSLLCTTFKNYTYVWDNEQKVPYKYLGDQWVSYEDERSIELKTKYIVSQEMAGIMIWQIGLDDVKGECGPKQGLLRVINNNLKNATLKREDQFKKQSCLNF